MKDLKDKVQIRGMELTDIPFIHNSWLTSQRQDSPILSRIPTGIWNDNKNEEIKGLLAKAYTAVLCLNDDPDHIIGYQSFSRIGKVRVLHYLLVKKVYQNLGFSRILLDLLKEDLDNTVVVSYLSNDFLKRYFNSDKRNYLYIYNPFILKEILCTN